MLEPVQTLRSIARFLDVAYTDDMLSYPEQAEHDLPAESTGWHRNSIRAPDATLVYQWNRRMPSADRIIFEEHAGDALATFGYALERRGSTLASRLKNRCGATERHAWAGNFSVRTTGINDVGSLLVMHGLQSHAPDGSGTAVLKINPGQREVCS